MKQKHLSQVLAILAMLVSLIVIGSAASLTDGQMIRGDCNGDGAINMKDVLVLRKYVANLPVEFADHVCSGGETVTVTVPGETVTVIVPGETVTVTVPGETVTVTVPVQTDPSQSYTQPSQSYTQPSQSYTQPSQSYTEPTQSYTEPTQSQTQPSQTQSQTEPSQTQSQTEPTQSQTQPSQTQSQTESTQSQTEPTQTQPSQVQSQPNFIYPSAAPTETTQATQPANSIKVQMNITEHKTKYASDVQTRDEVFYATIGQPVTLTLTYSDVYHSQNKEADGELPGWFALKANGASISPKEISVPNNNTVIATYDLGTASTDITISGDLNRYMGSSKIEDFKDPVKITVNGTNGSGGSVSNTPKVLDPDYPAVPDMVTLAFNDPATCLQYGLTFHSYKELSNPTIQYMEGVVTDPSAFDASALSITNITKSTDEACLTLDYDPINNWSFGTVDATSADVTRYTYKAVFPTTLTPGQTYSYRVGDPSLGVWTRSYSFTYQPSTSVGDNFSFLFLNDTQFSEGAAASGILKNMLTAASDLCVTDFGTSPQLMMHGGDYISTNINTFEYGNLFGANADFFGRYPMFGTLGNHDAEKKYFFNNWNVTNTTEKGYYSFTYGPMKVVVLDNSSEGLKRLEDKQITFLHDEMNSSDAEWKFVLLHRPVYGALTYNQNGSSTDPAKPYWEYGKPSLRYRMTNVCNEVGVDYVFQNHCHQYMRSYPITGYTKTGLADDAAIKDWDDTNDASYVQMDDNPTMTMENGTNYYVNPKGTVYGTFSTAGSDPDDVFSGSTSHKDGYEENKWVAYAANGQKYSFTACNISGNRFTIDHCYLTGTNTVNHYENTRGYGIKKTN